ncbi:hypothetical protein WJX81_001296 [Elliptochloris bilobata]|uniref:Uncharacterized protein n=1 Tax=Elliptochloris bilobata TaxID=381761 RepID=A0AAW1SJ81_9CHLO
MAAPAYPSDNPGATDAAMEAFYYGRAFMQTLGDRLGSALGEVLSEAGRHDAERRQVLREFQEEVAERARRDAADSQPAQPPNQAAAAPTPAGGPPPAAWGAGSGGSTYPSPAAAGAARAAGSANGTRPFSGNGVRPPPVIAAAPDLQVTVGELRAEVAATRDMMARYKAAAAVRASPPPPPPPPADV